MRGFVVGMLLAGSLLCNPIEGDASAQQKPSNAKSLPTKDAPPVDLSGVRDDLSRIADALESENVDNQSDVARREARDEVQAQRDMVFWAMVAAIVGGGTALVSAIGTGLLVLNLRQVNEANRDFVATSKREQRAYVVAHAVRAEHFEIDSAPIFRIAYENRGSTPARGVRWWTYLILAEGSEATIKISPEKKIILSDQRQVLGPGQSMEYLVPASVELTSEDFRKVVSGEMSYILAAVCRYRDVFGSRHWLTVKAIVLGDFVGSKEIDLAWCDRGNFAT